MGAQVDLVMKDQRMDVMIENVALEYTVKDNKLFGKETSVDSFLSAEEACFTLASEI